MLVIKEFQNLRTFKANPYTVPFTAAWDNMDSHQHRYYLRCITSLTENVEFTSTLFHNEFNRNWYKQKGISDAAFGISESTGDFNWTNKNNNRNYKVTGLQSNFDVELGANDIDLGFRVMKEDYIQNPYTEDVYIYAINRCCKHCSF